MLFIPPSQLLQQLGRTRCCSQHGADGSAGIVRPELGKIQMLEMEALGAVGFILDCFPDWYYKKKKCIRERMFDFKSASMPTPSLFVFLPLAETL